MDRVTAIDERRSRGWQQIYSLAQSHTCPVRRISFKPALSIDVAEFTYCEVAFVPGIELYVFDGAKAQRLTIGPSNLLNTHTES